MRKKRTTLRDDDIPAAVIDAWQRASETFLNKVSGKEIPPKKLDEVFDMWGTICGIFEVEPVKLANAWFKKYKDDAAEARRRLRHLAAGMSDVEFAALIGA